MIVSLFNDQLVLDVPDDTDWICFQRIPEIIEFCTQFNYGGIHVLTELDDPYFSLYLTDQTWYTTPILHGSLYDATDDLLRFIQQLKTYEYW